MKSINYITKDNYNIGLQDSAPVLATKFNEIARQFKSAIDEVEEDIDILQSKVGVLQALNATSGGTTNVTDTNKVLVYLTSANLLGMNASPVVVIPAPGSGKAIRLKSCVAIFDSTETAYSDGGVIYLSYNNNTPITNNLADTFLTGADKVCTLNPLNANGGINMLVNTALTIINDTAAFINGTGVVRLLVEYDIVTTGL